MDTSKLTPAQRQQRMNVRNFLLVARLDQLEKELTISEGFRRECVLELLQEAHAAAISQAIDNMMEPDTE